MTVSTHRDIAIPRLLMIDDDAALNKLLTEYLATFRYKLVTAVTAAEGRRLLKRDGADLVILDIMLPDTDGLTLCREFRSEFDREIEVARQAAIIQRQRFSDAVHSLDDRPGQPLDDLVRAIRFQLFDRLDAEEREDLPRLVVLLKDEVELGIGRQSRPAQ